MHGGGHVTGGLETDDSTCRAIALELDVVAERFLDRILSIDEIDDAPGLTRKSIDYFAGKRFLTS